MRPHRTRATGLVDLLVGTALAAVSLAALAAAVASGGRLLLAAGARGEAEDTVQLGVEALTFDARRAGYDPTASGVVPVAEARQDRVTFSADLDGTGTVDAGSEEVTTHLCSVATGRLSRIIGRQSMPLAEGVTFCGFNYLDGAGLPIAVPASGLDAVARARVRAVALDLELQPPGLRGRTSRTIVVALRRSP